MNLPKPLVVGAPRSGFSLLITVCSHILALLGVRSKRENKDFMMEILVELTSNYLKDQYFKAFHQLGIEKEVVFNGEFHLLIGGPKWLDKENPNIACIRKYIGLKGKGDFLLITSHPREALEYYPVLHSHDNPKLWYETEYYNQFIRMASIRNPIGIINSSSFSLNAMASEYLQKFLPGNDEDEIRQRQAAYKLTDLEFVKGLVNYLKRYFDQFLKIRSGYFEMKWEDLIKNPIPTIISIGNALGVNVPAEVAASIWKPMDHKNLMRYHKHNYRKGKGIVGDWKNSLINEHMDLFRECGFGEYLQELGYPPIPTLNPRDYSPYQKLIARYIQRGEIFKNTGDPDLFGFAFNKSNIDASKYNFKSFPKKKWTHVERTTIEDDSLTETISDQIEKACDRVNTILYEAIQTDWSDYIITQKAITSLEKQCRLLMNECANPECISMHFKLFSIAVQRLKMKNRSQEISVYNTTNTVV